MQLGVLQSSCLNMTFLKAIWNLDFLIRNLEHENSFFPLNSCFHIKLPTTIFIFLCRIYKYVRILIKLDVMFQPINVGLWPPPFFLGRNWKISIDCIVSSIKGFMFETLLRTRVLLHRVDMNLQLQMWTTVGVKRPIFKFCLCSPWRLYLASHFPPWVS